MKSIFIDYVQPNMIGWAYFQVHKSTLAQIMNQKINCIDQDSEMN